MSDDIRYITADSEEWPDLPEQFYSEGLWVKGAPLKHTLGDLPVAIVGARACTAYGSTVATEFAERLANQSCAIVSGGAFGIDAAAHRGALSSHLSLYERGRTIAVLPCGLDMAYPPAHASLFENIVKNGGTLVSMLPPGTPPTRQRFMDRNGLIVALSRGVVIVEGSLRSGTLNASNWAVQLGRPLMAVPGPITSLLSALPHRLIQEQKARIVTTPEEVYGRLVAASLVQS